MNYIQTHKPVDPAEALSPLLVVKGFLMRDGFPGSDCRAVSASTAQFELQSVVEATLASERDSLRAVCMAGTAAANAVGKAFVPPARMGIRVYYVHDKSVEDFYLSRRHPVCLKPFFESTWPVEYLNAEPQTLRSLSLESAKPLRVLLEEGCHLRVYQTAG